MGNVGLSVIRSLTENDDVPLEFARFVQPHSSGTLDVFRKFSKFPKLDDALNAGSSEPSWQIKNMWGETSSQKDGIIERDTSFHDLEDLIIQGPHFHVGNPLNKTPRSVCKKKEDYDNSDFSILSENYRPRANYVPRVDRKEYLRLMAGCAWDAGETHADFFRVALRNMINLNSERSLICALIPPGIAHVHTVESVAFKNSEDLINFHALSISLPFDFLVKASGREHISVSDVAGFPYLEVDPIAKHRALRLASLTADYRPIWNEFSHKLKTAPWSSDDPRLSYDASVEGLWNWEIEVGLRTDFARRLALIEVDVLVAQALSLSLDQLIEIYRIYFPVLQRKESKTYYDGRGRIVYISAKGMETVGYLNEKGKTPSQKEWLKILADNPSELTCTAIDDTMPGGPRTVTRHFVGPFTQCDRIEDYRRAWAHFERLKSEEAA